MKSKRMKGNKELSQDARSPENLYLVGTLLLFILLPFQNCEMNPISGAWANGDPSYKVEIRKEEAHAVGTSPQKTTLVTRLETVSP